MTEPCSHIIRPAVVAACLTLAACGQFLSNKPPPDASWDTIAAPAATGARPGSVESAEAESVIPSLPQGRRPPGLPMPLTAPPVPIALSTSMAPTVAPATPEKRAELARDPELRRFVILSRLVDEGLAGPDDADRRRVANLGALLPFSAAPPAAGLERPLPSEDELLQRMGELVRGSTGIALARSAERGFLLEELLPLRHKAKAPPVRTDPEALRLGRSRIDRLAAAQLVSPAEREQELAAIARAEEAIASQPVPPPAPPPAKPVKKKKTSVVPGLDAPGSGPAGVHLLSMASAALEDRAWAGLKQQHAELAALEHKVVKTVIPDLGTTYRLLAGPLPPPEAELLCRTLRTKGQSCSVAKY